jgi:hypothetical protein
VRTITNGICYVKGLCLAPQYPDHRKTAATRLRESGRRQDPSWLL